MKEEEGWRVEAVWGISGGKGRRDFGIKRDDIRDKACRITLVSQSVIELVRE